MTPWKVVFCRKSKRAANDNSTYYAQHDDKEGVMMNVLTWCLVVMSAFLEDVLTEFGEMEQEGEPGTTVAIFGGETVASTGE